ncbi:hypothetical protein [uncultured Hymenobacter sp.]|uniref:hypothetical protein n=1 Tax=uncultured Hymenobacter sp. TaxID=170016 RepID=UPI0035CA82B6
MILFSVSSRSSRQPGRVWSGRTFLSSSLLISGLLSGGGAARAQQLAPATIRLQTEDLERGLNGQQRNFYFLPPGATGENYQSAGFFGQKLRPYLAVNPEALRSLNQYRRQKTLFLAERLVFVGAVGLYGQQVLAGDKRQYFNPTQQVAVGVAAASLLTNILISRNTNHHLLRAVEAYNAGRTGSLWRRAQPTNMVVRCTSAGQPSLALSWSLR